MDELSVYIKNITPYLDVVFFLHNADNNIEIHKYVAPRGTVWYYSLYMATELDPTNIFISIHRDGKISRRRYFILVDGKVIWGDCKLPKHVINYVDRAVSLIPFL